MEFIRRAHDLDLYSLYNWIQVILDYLQSIDPRTAEPAKAVQNARFVENAERCDRIMYCRRSV